ncbi:hypothetical protein EVAR_65774_1 [Eumeta japonica]|uniref:Uncharacterized protein n=1 Tax=Eumeta variegata TaxID=151549 RepID=A0A4C2A6R1_EUMVA|nr:hypothetical protein EVAR_65774_1 [Eumeta japonica]
MDTSGCSVFLINSIVPIDDRQRRLRRCVAKYDYKAARFDEQGTEDASYTANLTNTHIFTSTGPDDPTRQAGGPNRAETLVDPVPPTKSSPRRDVRPSDAINNSDRQSQSTDCERSLIYGNWEQKKNTKKSTHAPLERQMFTFGTRSVRFVSLRLFRLPVTSSLAPVYRSWNKICSL